MVTTTCDVCKKKVDNPFNQRTFFYYPAVGICESCNDALEAQLKPNARNKQPFSYDWYYKMIDDTLEKGMSKGKI